MFSPTMAEWGSPLHKTLPAITSGACHVQLHVFRPQQFASASAESGCDLQAQHTARQEAAAVMSASARHCSTCSDASHGVSKLSQHPEGAWMLQAQHTARQEVAAARTEWDMQHRLELQQIQVHLSSRHARSMQCLQPCAHLAVNVDSSCNLKSCILSSGEREGGGERERERERERYSLSPFSQPGL